MVAALRLQATDVEKVIGSEMTISVAWIRNCGSTPELIFASDSRLNGGGNVDHCQKIFAMPREDCCISFAGSTTIAYPFIQQLINVVREHERFMDRAVDIRSVHGRVVRLLNWFIGTYEGTVPSDFANELRETAFIFGGWSWQKSEFYLWRILYNKYEKKYISRQSHRWKAFKNQSGSPYIIAFIGDYPDFYYKGLRNILREKIEANDGSEAPHLLDHEPLEALANMLTDPEYIDRYKENRGKIGGSPQVTKIFPYLRTTAYAVEWTAFDRPVYSLSGRVLAAFERFTVPSINPFTGMVSRAIAPRPAREEEILSSIFWDDEEV